MELELREFDTRDVRKVEEFARIGMHFDDFDGSELAIRAYGWSFVIYELARATQVIAAYDGDELAGLLLATFAGEKKACHLGLRGVLGNALMAIIDRFDRSQRDYQKANEELLADMKSRIKVDGEIGFLTANPAIIGKGTGRRLMEELARREAGKTVFLYTDSGCNFGFYEHLGFELQGEREIVVNSKGGLLRCMIYTKTFA